MYDCRGSSGCAWWCLTLCLEYENTRLRAQQADSVLQGQQWVRMVVLGQSFMLHQIRKLVGTAVAVMRGDAPPECIQLALQPERHMVRRVPLRQKHIGSCSIQCAWRVPLRQMHKLVDTAVAAVLQH